MPDNLRKSFLRARPWVRDLQLFLAATQAPTKGLLLQDKQIYGGATYAHVTATGTQNIRDESLQKPLCPNPVHLVSTF